MPAGQGRHVLAPLPEYVLAGQAVRVDTAAHCDQAAHQAHQQRSCAVTPLHAWHVREQADPALEK